jgi:hypothetical protein
MGNNSGDIIIYALTFMVAFIHQKNSKVSRPKFFASKAIAP